MNPQWQAQLRDVAAQLLRGGTVKMVVGYGAGTLPGRTTPVFITQPEQAGQLVLNAQCENNLVNYLPRLCATGPVAVVAKPCDVRTLVSLIQEKQVSRDRVHIISFACSGLRDATTGQAPEGCVRCTVFTPPLCDTLIGEREVERPASVTPPAPAIAPLVAEPPEERWRRFQEEMDKCIRCYACRNACPLCYCAECFVERSFPRWVGEGAELTDTMIFHIVRVLHSAGRCGECGACVRACPMGVSLDLLTTRINEDLLTLFQHRAGLDPEAPAAMAAFSPDDYNEFIK